MSSIQRLGGTVSCQRSHQHIPVFTLLPCKPQSCNAPARQVHRLGVRMVACRATLDDPEFQPYIKELERVRPDPPADRKQLERAMALIDAANSKDPKKVTWEGEKVPYRLLYSRWLTDCVKKVDPKASDELLLLARGRSVEGWKVADIKRDDYLPSAAGVKMWENDKRKWQAQRLVEIMKEAGYGEDSCALVEGVMGGKGVPDPGGIRIFDIKAPLGAINYKVLEQAVLVQALRDGEALVFMERSLPQMVQALEPDAVIDAARKELSRVSAKCLSIIASMKWSAVENKIITKALPAPKCVGAIVRDIEGATAASIHPGDWRYRNFDYE